MTSPVLLEIDDLGAGSLAVSWGAFQGITPASYNVYVNGVVVQNVVTRSTTITGLTATSYAVAAVAPTPNNSSRPQSMPPNGVVTDSLTYDIKVTAVVAGLEVATTPDRQVTVQPTSLMLTTPMKRIFPFPNTGLN